MDCKEFEKRIPDFIGNRLDYSGMKQFVEHREQCENCQEELAIQLLVTEGIHRLEEGNAFDLQQEVDQRLERTRREIRTRERIIGAGLAMEAVAACIVSWLLIWLLVS